MAYSRWCVRQYPPRNGSPGLLIGRACFYGVCSRAFGRRGVVASSNPTALGCTLSVLSNRSARSRLMRRFIMRLATPLPNPANSRNLPLEPTSVQPLSVLDGGRWEAAGHRIDSLTLWTGLLYASSRLGCCLSRGPSWFKKPPINPPLHRSRWIADLYPPLLPSEDVELGAFFCDPYRFRGFIWPRAQVDGGYNLHPFSRAGSFGWLG